MMVRGSNKQGRGLGRFSQISTLDSLCCMKDTLGLQGCNDGHVMSSYCSPTSLPTHLSKHQVVIHFLYNYEHS
jgi:hypothetical protein